MQLSASDRNTEAIDVYAGDSLTIRYGIYYQFECNSLGYAVLHVNVPRPHPVCTIRNIASNGRTN